MKTKSAKAKGRRLQDWVAKQFNGYGFRCRPAIMGETGSDVKFLDKDVWFNVECKNTEKVNVWNAWNQVAVRVQGDEVPLVFIKRNHSKPLAIVDAEWLFHLIGSK